MDRQLKKKKWTSRKILFFSGSVLLVFICLYTLVFAKHRSKLKVDSSKITIATIQEGDFQEWIPETGLVQPIESYFLDAIEGGIVQELNIETGAMVQAGTPLITLINSNLQLEVLNREAQLYEQINNLRTSRLLLNQNIQNLEKELVEVDYQLQLATPDFKRQKGLYEAEVISLKEFEESQERFEYHTKRKAILTAAYQQEQKLKAVQFKQLNDSEARMWKSLEAVGKILDNLVIKAPWEGQFASEQLEIGQSIQQGQRLGQIDVVDDFKLRVQVDELYLSRINVGQEASYVNPYGKVYRLKVTKVYPTISQGSFEVDMEFQGDTPEGIKRGQSLRIRIELSHPGRALLLPAGGFFQSTGGNWVFVLDDSGEKAMPRKIRLGRKNYENYEVLEGLQPGDHVITSSYADFDKYEILILK
ncbi:HlyD family efflux transporter periplasmic adaptor subunit [Rapidithrix thailandica]|uniref:HlyD family efflux transporter periplasmic adaptor subunit n=1 Tax=Rapidithrix thailandica TaxID=413964 RepID=A0AAW9SCD9_9BACT